MGRMNVKLHKEGLEEPLKMEQILCHYLQTHEWWQERKGNIYVR